MAKTKALFFPVDSFQELSQFFEMSEVGLDEFLPLHSLTGIQQAVM